MWRSSLEPNVTVRGICPEYRDIPSGKLADQASPASEAHRDPPLDTRTTGWYRTHVRLSSSVDTAVRGVGPDPSISHRGRLGSQLSSGGEGVVCAAEGTGGGRLRGVGRPGDCQVVPWKTNLSLFFLDRGRATTFIAA